jgi:hypothetical protein
MKRFALLSLASWFLTTVLPGAEDASALLTRGLDRVAALLDPEAKEPAELRTTIEFLRSEGLPKELRGAKLDLILAAPNHLRLGTVVDKQRIEFGRHGQQLWVWQPAKNFAVQGVPGVPRFSANPKSIDRTELAPLGLQLDREVLGRLTKLLQVSTGESQTIDGEKCREIFATLPNEAREAFGMAGMNLALALREKDALPVRVAVRTEKIDAEIALHQLQTGPMASPDVFALPATKEAKVERVAVSHLSNFVSAAVAALDSKAPPLGPVKGERRLVATHGAGRLELHDETRVLFVKGSPEEIGEQHGTLLRGPIRDVVRRVLYGVGVGSSFGKGRWFFGEIEGCVARLSPFINPRTLREMDALAKAAGLEAEEVRLANFFPEMFHCSGFALLGEATEGGRIYHGRILDYMKGIGLERNAVVTVYQPDQGHAWVNIGYAGFTGSVTAMNDQHISIGEMGGRGEGNWDGKPMAQLLREVMEKAGTLDEAIEIMRRGPRTCEYFYVIADGRTHTAVGIKATPDIFEVVRPGEAHPQLATPVKDTVLLSAGDRYRELVKRVQTGFGSFDADRARDLMTRPVCMTSNIHSVLFAPDTLDFWVANADAKNVASHSRYTKYSLRELLAATPAGD